MSRPIGTKPWIIPPKQIASTLTPASPARRQAQAGGGVPAGAGAAGRETRAVHAQFIGGGDDPARGRPRVADRRRELVLRRQSVIEGDAADPRLRRHLPAGHIVAL